MLPKAVVMDLGDTIIDIKELDFYKGFKYIYDKYCIHEVSYETLYEDLVYMHKIAFPARRQSRTGSWRLLLREDRYTALPGLFR